MRSLSRQLAGLGPVARLAVAENALAQVRTSLVDSDLPEAAYLLERAGRELRRSILRELRSTEVGVDQ